MDIPIQKPENNKVNGEEYSYTPGDASVGDLDGDGEYEIVLKWDRQTQKTPHRQVLRVNVFLTRTSLTVHVYGV